MKRFSDISLCFVTSALLAISPVGQAYALQEEVAEASQVTLVGDPTQPGYQIQSRLFELVETSDTLEQALARLRVEIEDGGELVSSLISQSIGLDYALFEGFLLEITNLRNLSEATQSVIIEEPEKVSEVVTLAVLLFPDLAQDVINAAAFTGELSGDDALVLALAAGADPTTVSAATAAGPAAGAVAAAPNPVGGGVGAGGTGGGDTTASPN